MAEEKQSTGRLTAEKKKTNKIKQVLKLFGLILLSFLTILAIVFQAPWKVTALFVIILAACTILPKPYLKWFWLSVGAIVLALIIWVFLPEDNQGWRPYTFDKELAQLQAKYAVPDSENAAIAYNKIFADWEQKEANEPNLSRNKLDSARRNFWLSKDYPEVTAYMKYYQDTLDQLVKASTFERCSSPIISDTFVMSEHLGPLSAMRQWAYLFEVAGNNDIAEGRTNEAIEKYHTLFRMGQHLSQQPESLDVLTSIGIEALGLRCINNFVVSGDANEFYLDKLEQTVSAIKHDWSSDLPGFIDTDKLMFKNVCGWMFYQTNDKGQVRLGCDPSAIMRELTQKQSVNETINVPEFFSSYWFKKLMKAYIIIYWFYAPQTPEKLSQIVDASFEKHYLMTKPNFDWSKEPNAVPIEPFCQFKLNFRRLTEVMARINRDVYFGLHDTYLRQSAEQRGALLIIALRRYKNKTGHWPESLDEIKSLAPAEIFVDPMNRDSFVYKLTEEGFTLYSKGKNNIDEGGKYTRRYGETSEGDDWLIWPPKRCKGQEEKTDDEQQ